MSLDKFHEKTFAYAKQTCDELEQDMLYARGICRALKMPFSTGTKELRKDMEVERLRVLLEIADNWDKGKPPIPETEVIPLIEKAINALYQEKNKDK